MAPVVQASPSPSPHPSPPRPPEPSHGAVADPPPPVPPTRDEWPEPEKPPSAPDSPPPPLSTAVVVSSQPQVAAARYVPPRGASRTADPDSGRSADAGWYSWNGGRSARSAPRSRPAPPSRRWKRDEEAPRIPPPPPAPAPAPPPAPRPAPAPPPPAVRPVDRVVPDILSRKRRTAALQRAALVARAVAAGLCLAALAVLAADTRKGWALDSYSRYSQLRYSEAVNVIGFLYSLIQFAMLAELMRKNKHLIPHPKRDLLDFTMDQVLAYLLISSSSSATARVEDWIDNWGNDPFPNMAKGSIVISFLAFMVVAICALISAYNLFRRDL